MRMKGCAKMRMICKRIDILKTLLPPQEVVADKKYRPISFCFLTEVDGQQVAYNSFTGEIIEITEDERKLLSSDFIYPSEDTKELIEAYYFVPVEQDDIDLADEIRGFAKALMHNDGIRNYLIFPTMDCNARCFYCYEMGRPRTSMSPKIAEDVVGFIAKNAPKDKKVKIIWFGGEPLYNYQVIDIITNGLREKGIEFHSQMISNGFLFSDEIVARAKHNWNLKRLQITLDGTESVYNKAKAYINAKGLNPFEIVTNNIERLLKNDIAVSVRLNMGEHNKKDLIELVDWLAERYRGYDNLVVYAHLLFEYYENNIKEEASLPLINDLLEIEERCINYKLAGNKLIKHKLVANHCMADSSDSITITPTGKLGKCEHFTESDFVGNIYDGITDYAKLDEFKQVRNSKEVCSGCVAYPTCARLKKCPDLGPEPCSPAQRLIVETGIRHRVTNTYKKLKEEQKNKAE